MGFFDFLKGNGREAKEQDLAESIRVAIRDGLRGEFHEPRVAVDDGTATLYGRADSVSAKQRAVLVAGNFKGIEQVNDDNVEIRRAPAAPTTTAAEAAATPPDAGAEFYTIQKGDTLSKIAQEKLGDANKWQALHRANTGVIDDPDKIYPGQVIRIPNA